MHLVHNWLLINDDFCNYCSEIRLLITHLAEYFYLEFYQLIKYFKLNRNEPVEGQDFQSIPHGGWGYFSISNFFTVKKLPLRLRLCGMRVWIHTMMGSRERSPPIYFLCACFTVILIDRNSGSCCFLGVASHGMEGRRAWNTAGLSFSPAQVDLTWPSSHRFSSNPGGWLTTLSGHPGVPRQSPHDDHGCT